MLLKCMQVELLAIASFKIARWYTANSKIGSYVATPWAKIDQNENKK